MNNLRGKKTYISAGLIAIATFARAANLINEETHSVLVGLIGSIGLASLRSAIVKSTK